MRVPRVILLWLQVVGASVAIVAICWLIVQSVFHLKLLNVQTASMRPSFRPGDALIMQRASEQDLHIGMIVSYHSPRNYNELITHRVMAVSQGNFQTKGDSLTSPDPAVRSSLVAGRVVAVLPNMGKVLSWVQTWPGLIVCIYLPATAIAVSELYRFEQRYRQLHVYHLHERQVV